MTDDQYRELADFLGGQFGGVNRRLDAVGRNLAALERRTTGLDGNIAALEGLSTTLERRTAAVEVGREADGSDLRLLAEGVGANTVRIARLESTMNRRFDAVDDRFTRLEATVAGRP